VEDGVFARHGIRLEATDNPTGADSRRAIAAGAFDAGHGGAPNVLGALARTDGMKVVGTGLVRFAPFSLVARPEVESVRGLAGRPVTINKRNTCSHGVLRAALSRESMEERDVRLAEAGDGGAIVRAVRGGATDAAVLWEPWVSHVVRADGWRILVEGRTALRPSGYAVLIYASRTLLEARPAAVAGLLDAYRECVSRAQADPGRAAAAVGARMPGMPAQDLEAGMRREAVHWTPDPRLDEALLARVVAELRSQGVVPAAFDVSGVLARVP
jgi:NitT/TauT family transport system substrate-binding protein